MFTQLRFKLALVNALVMFCILTILIVGATIISRNYAASQESMTLHSSTESLVPQATLALSGKIPISEILQRTDSELDISLVLWNAQGTPIYNPQNLPVVQLGNIANESQRGISVTSTIRFGNDVLYVYSIPVRDDGRVIGTIQGIQDREDLQTLESGEIFAFLLSATFAALIALIAAWILSGRAMRPIISAYERQRNFTAEASHEIRTPLTIIDSGIQILERHPQQPIADNIDVIDSMKAEVTRLKRIIQDLLDLARSEAGKSPLILESMPPDAIIRAVVSDLQNLATEHNSTLILGPLDPHSVRIDEDRIRQLLIIILENALMHTPENTTSSISSSVLESEYIITVRDNGPGITASEREKVFERFHRLGTKRLATGSGLGLPIAKEIVLAHKGSLVLSDANPGLVVTITLPHVQTDIA